MTALMILAAVYGTVVAVLTVAIWIVDRFRFWNDAVERIWRLPAAEDRDPSIDWRGFERQSDELRALPTVEPRRRNLA